MRNKIISGLAVLIIVLAVILFAQYDRSEEISNDKEKLIETTGTVKENGGYTTISTRSIPGADSRYNFSFSVLDDWKVQSVSQGSSLNIYSPEIEAGSALEKSRIFVRYFVANNFQTPDSVNILSRVERNINGREAVTYVISKKESSLDFSGQPSWRNKTHKTVDIRLSADNPTVFYVFAKNPEVSDGEFERFLDSIIFN